MCVCMCVNCVLAFVLVYVLDAMSFVFLQVCVHVCLCVPYD